MGFRSYDAACCLFFLLLILVVVVEPSFGQKVAVIGGGISGTFTTKYLVDYDRVKCQLESITIFDPNPIGQLVTPSANSEEDEEWQGSRVAAVELDDGKIIELGASVFHEANYLVKEMIDNDPNLEIGKPFNIGQNEANKAPTSDGLGIYDGSSSPDDNNDQEAFLFQSNKTDPWNTFWTLLRYNFDLYKVDRATTKAQNLFSQIPALLNSTASDTFFVSPDEMWNRTSLLKLVHHSFDTVLDSIWVTTSNGNPSWLLPYQGSIRRELLTAINQINYNQGNSQINGLVGLASFAASKGPLYSVVGGNPQIVGSAFQQAQTNRQTNCPSSDDEQTTIQHQQHTITTVIGSHDGFELFAGDTKLGTYDTVILAAPLQQCRIRFLIPSQWDGAVLQSMPLGDGGMVDADAVTSEDHEGHAVLPNKLPDCARRKYTQVVTTVVSNAQLNHHHFGLSHANKLPRAVCTTEVGKAKEYNITVISQIAGDGVYKVFSSNKLNNAIRTELFGSNHKLEYEKVWGGEYGGATPDYQGSGTSVGYLLYDGATGLSGHTNSGALYYVNAIETSLACMEASAIGAKSVAKLVAQRLEILVADTTNNKHDGEEL